MGLDSRHIIGMRVDSGNYSTMTQTIRKWALNKESRRVCVANVHMAMETVDSPDFKAIVNSSDMVTSDGMPLVWMLRKLGLKQSERVYGPTLVLHVCRMAEASNLKIGLYGGTDESLDSFTSFLSTEFPNLKVSFSWSPPFRALTDQEDEWVTEEINKTRPDILFVGIGCPKQEKWMHQHKDVIQSVQIGVGAAFDFHSGRIAQAPSWMQKIGMEWFFRLLMEPRRLWKRYVLLNPRFMIRALGQLLSKRSTAIAVLALLLASFSSPVEQFAQPQTYWVMQNHPAASDSNPGTQQLPFQSISAALDQHVLSPGDTVYIGQGVYRESIRPMVGGVSASSPLVISGIDGQEVVVSGADVYGAPEPAGGTRWLITNYNPLDYYGDDELYYRELIVADGRTLRPVFQASDLESGRFFVDPINESITIDTGSEEVPVIQMARRSRLFKPGIRDQECGHSDSPSFIELSNIQFVHAANPAQYGALCAGAQGTTFKNIHVSWTNGVGVQLIGTEHSMTNSSSNHNGQSGINGACTRCSLTNVETSFNNWRGHDPFWEAGGGKWTGSSHVSVVNLTAKGNDGPGLWFDGDNHTIAVSYSLLDSNLVAGLFFELNTFAVSVEYVTVRQTRRDGWSGAGMLVQAAGDITVSNSLFERNDGAGIWLRRDDRAPSGFNSILANSFSENALIPDQDRADIQIGAHDLTGMCSNQIAENTPKDDISFYIEVDTLSESMSGSDITSLFCLVKYE